MIQRIQTVWFLIATLLLGLTFLFDIYKQTSIADLANLSLGNDLLGIITVSVAMLLSFYTIFLFKNRKKQITFAWFSIISALVAFAYLYIACDRYTEQYNIVDGHYWIGLFMPLLSLVFLFMGLFGIRKDQKLIKSLDRLR